MAGTIVVNRIEADSSYTGSINVASKINFSGGMQVGGIDSPLSGMRNRLINGAMQIDQRFGGSANTPATTGSSYGIDRWRLANSVASKFTIQRNAGGVTPPAGFTNYWGATTASGYSPGSSEEFVLLQTVEGNNVSDFAYGTSSAKTTTLSFWVYGSTAGTYTASLYNGNSVNKSILMPYTINQANTWEYKTVSFVGDTATAIANTSNGAGLDVRFSLGSGSGFTTSTSGAWISGNYHSLSGETSITSTTGRYLYITGVQWEVGGAATPFEFRQYGTEFALCQRYYEKGGMSRRSGNRTSGTYETTPIFYKVQKRTTPTFAISNGYTADGWGTYGVGGHDNPSGSNDPTCWGNMEVIATSSISAYGIMACLWTSSAEF